MKLMNVNEKGLKKSIFSKKVLSLISILSILFMVACTGAPPEDKAPMTQEESIGNIQQTACDVAQDAGTCETNLREMGMISPEECCNKFQKCCGDLQ